MQLYIVALHLSDMIQNKGEDVWHKVINSGFGPYSLCINHANKILECIIAFDA